MSPKPLFVPVVRDGNWSHLIGQMTKYSRWRRTVTIHITDPEVWDELAAMERPGISLTIEDVPRHHERRRPSE